MKNKRQKIIIINKIFFSSIFSNGRKDITRSKWIIHAIKRKQIKRIKSMILSATIVRKPFSKGIFS